MPRPRFIEFSESQSPTRIPILYEDRSVIAIDKPAGWMLVPFSWQRTQRNLQAAVTSSIAAGDFWAKSRNLKFLRHVHRLDAETTGVLLMAKSIGAVKTLGSLFESRQMNKTYLAVVHGVPKESDWTLNEPLAPDPRHIGRMRIDQREGKPSETRFRVLARSETTSLIEAQPITGRTHQIRVHLQVSGHPVLGDPLYGPITDRIKPPARIAESPIPLGLRAASLAYRDPFRHQAVVIQAPSEEFLARYGYDLILSNRVENSWPQAQAPTPHTTTALPPRLRPGVSKPR